MLGSYLVGVGRLVCVLLRFGLVTLLGFWIVVFWLTFGYFGYGVSWCLFCGCYNMSFVISGGADLDCGLWVCCARCFVFVGLV